MVGEGIMSSDRGFIPAGDRALHGAEVVPSGDKTLDEPSNARGRFVSVHFPAWTLDVAVRALHRRIDGEALARTPVVVVEEISGAMLVVGANGPASRSGVEVGASLAEAESRCDADAFDDAVRQVARALRDGPDARWRQTIVGAEGRVLALRSDARRGAWMHARLAECLSRWIPSVMPIGDGSRAGMATGLVGDLTGCGALFRRQHGTEHELMRRMHASLARRGFRTNLATASTIGAAVALAQADGEAMGLRPWRAIPHGSEAEVLAPLPIESLRIGSAAAEALRSVEVCTIGELALLRRDGVAARLEGRFDHEASGEAPSSRRAVRGAGTRPRRTAGNVAASPLFDPGDAHARPRGGVEKPVGSSRQASGATARVGGVEIWRQPRFDGVLRRLDQALGLAPERIEPIRLRPPLELVRDLEAPVTRVEILLRVVAGEVARLADALLARREGLRGARIVFEHARFPSDTELIGAPWRAETVVELRPGRPTVRRAHLWSLVQPRLESIPLEYGIERIRWIVLDTARLRYRQCRIAGLAQGRAGGAVRHADSVVPQVARESIAAIAGLPKSSGSGIAAVERSVAHGSLDSHEPADNEGERGAAIAEWIDLIRARLGEDAVLQAHTPAQPWSLDAAPWRIMVHAADDDRGIAARRAAGAPAAESGRALPSEPTEWPRTNVEVIRHARADATAPPDRPTRMFEVPDRALLSVWCSEAVLPGAGGDEPWPAGICDGGFVACMQRRIAWCSTRSARRDAAGCEPVAVEARRDPVTLRWGGSALRVVAADGWERIAGPWWSSCSGASHGGPTGVADARLVSRLCIEGGVWVLVRWLDEQMASCAIGEPHRDAGASVVSGRTRETVREFSLEVLGVWA